MSSMDVSEYLKFYSELGVSHLKLPETNGKVRVSTRDEASVKGSPFLCLRRRLARRSSAIRDEMGTAGAASSPADGDTSSSARAAQGRAHVRGRGSRAGRRSAGTSFCGQGGQLLTKIIEAIELRRDDVYIANILKCGAQQSPPEPDESPPAAALCSGK